YVRVPDPAFRRQDDLARPPRDRDPVATRPHLNDPLVARGGDDADAAVVGKEAGPVLDARGVAEDRLLAALDADRRLGGHPGDPEERGEEPRMHDRRGAGNPADRVD